MRIENWNVVTDPESSDIPQHLILTGDLDGEAITIMGVTDIMGPAGEERAFDIEGNVHVLGARLT